MKKWCLPLLFILTACAEDSDERRVANVLFNAVTGTVNKVPRERAAAIPYATIGVELGSSDQVLFVLGTSIENELDWFAGDQVFVRTRAGRVIRTVGLPYDLGGLRTVTATGANAGGGTTPTLYSLDFPDLGVFGATAQCTAKDLGEETVEILGARIPTRHTSEHCTVPAMRWNFDNEFWQDRTSGYVWRSSQHIHPKSPPLILEVLRPEQAGGR